MDQPINTENNSSSHEEPKTESKSYLPTIIVPIAVAIIAGVGVYLWQQSSVNNEKENLQNQVNGLQNQVDQLKDEAASGEFEFYDIE